MILPEHVNWGEYDFKKNKPSGEFGEAGEL